MKITKNMQVQRVELIKKLTDKYASNPLILGIVRELSRDDITKEEWFEIHSKCLGAWRVGRTLVKLSRDVGINKFGEEFVADSEVQIELDLGINFPEEKQRLNPRDKSTAIVTIEGIRQGFDLWRRKMEKEIPTWDSKSRKKACELLRPMVEFYDFLLSEEAK